MITVIRIYQHLLYMQTVLITAEHGLIILKYASKQHVHNKCHILSLKIKYLET